MATITAGLFGKCHVQIWRNGFYCAQIFWGKLDALACLSGWKHKSEGADRRSLLCRPFCIAVAAGVDAYLRLYKTADLSLRKIPRTIGQTPPRVFKAPFVSD